MKTRRRKTIKNRTRKKQIKNRQLRKRRTKKKGGSFPFFRKKQSSFNKKYKFYRNYLQFKVEIINLIKISNLKWL